MFSSCPIYSYCSNVCRQLLDAIGQVVVSEIFRSFYCDSFVAALKRPRPQVVQSKSTSRWKNWRVSCLPVSLSLYISLFRSQMSLAVPATRYAKTIRLILDSRRKRLPPMVPLSCLGHAYYPTLSHCCRCPTIRVLSNARQDETQVPAPPGAPLIPPIVPSHGPAPSIHHGPPHTAGPLLWSRVSQSSSPTQPSVVF
jgi:hypothetical protein